MSKTSLTLRWTNSSNYLDESKLYIHPRKILSDVLGKKYDILNTNDTQYTELQIIILKCKNGTYWYKISDIAKISERDKLNLIKNIPLHCFKTFEQLNQNKKFNISVKPSSLFVNDEGLQFVFYENTMKSYNTFTS